MQFSKFYRFFDTEKKVLCVIFLFLTGIASIQFAQYFIAYNSSYPFPWKYQLSATYGFFYSYFLFVPLIYRLARWIHGLVSHLGQRFLLHLLGAVMIGAVHLLVVLLIDWTQGYRSSEALFGTTYRWKLASWLHLEVFVYGMLVVIWYGLEWLKWQKEEQKSGSATIDQAQEYPSQIKVKEGGHIEYIPVERVLWIEAYDNYIKLHVPGRFYLVRETLGSIEKRLDPARFHRIHRSYIVALKEVDKLKTNGGNYEVMLKEGTTLKLSRTYKTQLESRLETI